ncbi:hypothetical protein E2562_016276 [Oryza meyeriana var. granulata]|uniref:Uncharacterized protein n=1 Tax=Oryza meyeriana var. granulata TaxID=110450 RepID=A0A6G1CQQ1_9ORYZ|nr:hypothetical protein E2562_016276 [Oryza meyeriana var. granulata]
MVVALGPGRFYGSSLPRPRFFAGGDRVDPPVPVTDPLLAWAHEAHWSMGGLSSKRLRLQGRIEGSIDKLRRRARRDARAAAKARAAGLKPDSLAALGSDDDDSDEEAEAQERILKREVIDEPSESESEEEQEENEEEEEEALATIAAAAKRKRARKLSDEFDRVATLQDGEAKKQKPAAATSARTSPRRKAAEVAPTPAAAAPARASPRRKATEAAPAPAAVTPARASPRRKAAAAASTPVAGARRISPRMKH